MINIIFLLSVILVLYNICCLLILEESRLITIARLLAVVFLSQIIFVGGAYFLLNM